MEDIVGTSRAGLSIHEAAVILGVSPNTVRRRVAAGSLRSKRLPRPQGEVIRVYLDRMPDQVPEQVPPHEVPGDVPNEVPPTSPPQVPDAARAEVMGALISASITPVLAPLVAQLAADRQTIERQGETIRDQAETIGTLRSERDAARAELVAARAPQQPVEAPTAPQTFEPATEQPRGRWHQLVPWLPAALMLAVVVALGVLLALR